MKLDGLNTKYIGRNVVYFRKIDSTQLESWRNRKLVSGTVIIADIQTNGKGTHGRVWYKKSEKDIAFSLKVNVNCDVKRLQNITIDIAKIIVDEFKDLYNIELDIKMPNDIVINGKKVGGILTETRIIGRNVKEMVIGIGINLHKQKFTEDLKDIATSIENEYNTKINRLKIISEFCNRFEKLLLNIE